MTLPTNAQLGKLAETAAAVAGVTARRQRRWIAANALLEIFNIAVSNGTIPHFIIKGGFAIELRFLSAARSSRDVDLVIPLDADELLDATIAVLRTEWSGFSFRIKGQPERREHSFKFEINVRYQGREWSTFELDLVFESLNGSELIPPFALTKFGLQSPSPIPCITVSEQIAQKLHSVSDPSEDRPRDLIDIYLYATRLAFSDGELLRCCRKTFTARNTHTWPPNIAIRDGWEEQLRGIIESSDLGLSPASVISGVRHLVARLMGVAVAQNYQYHFLVLQGRDPVPDTMSAAIAQNDAFTVFTRMTESEGWRLVQIMPYPSSNRPGSAVLAILEKPIHEATVD